jgi:two-component system chemotaxis response regulator CheB
VSKIRVLIVDDSAVVREVLSRSLQEDERFEVVATAIDPYSAREKLARLGTDVMTLDIEMPRMDGLTFLKQLMKHHPIPVVVVSSLTDGANSATMQALELGALDVVPKPGGAYSVTDIVELLKDRLIAASKADFSVAQAQAALHRERLPIEGTKMLSQIATTNKLLAVGASTGGTLALETLFTSFSPDFPPAVCVIHMPEKFTATYAERLDRLCRVRVKEAEDGEMVRPATVYLAPGNFHLLVRMRGKDVFLKVAQGPKVQHQRPAVDVLFESVASQVGQNAVGVLLTGMGRDGAAGLLKILKAGGRTIAQDEATSVVFGMPKEAIEIGAAQEILPLDKIARALRP